MQTANSSTLQTNAAMAQPRPDTVLEGRIGQYRSQRGEHGDHGQCVSELGHPQQPPAALDQGELAAATVGRDLIAPISLVPHGGSLVP